MKFIYFLLVLLVTSFSALSQVSSHIFEKSDAFTTFSKLKAIDLKKNEIKEFQQVNVKALLAENEDYEILDIPFRFGYGMDVNWGLEDGEWIEEGDKRIWNMRITSLGAYSLNFIFENMFLAPDAELYIFSSDGKMVYGPVTETQNSPNGTFLTDLIMGDDVVIQLHESKNSKKRFDFSDLKSSSCIC